MPELENNTLDGAPELEEEQQAPVKNFSFVKVGIPVLLAQIVIAYLLASYVIVPRLYGDSAVASEQTENADEPEEAEMPEFGKIFAVEDVIANPADSQGSQFVLINFGFEVKEDNDVKLMSDRQIQVRDILLNILSTKTLAQLDGPDDKEILRQEVKEALKKLLPPNHLMNVYFSNYIIQ